MDNLRIILKDGTRRVYTRKQWNKYFFEDNYLIVTDIVTSKSIAILRVPKENVLLIERF